MPERYAEYVDPANGHNKFYRVQWADDSNDGRWCTHYGRIGTKGAFQFHDAENQTAARKCANAKINSKLKKGYVEVAGQLPPGVAKSLSNKSITFDAIGNIAAKIKGVKGGTVSAGVGGNAQYIKVNKKKKAKAKPARFGVVKRKLRRSTDDD